MDFYLYLLDSNNFEVSGNDLAGNSYLGTDSITFYIDNEAPTVILTDTDENDIISSSDIVTITANFSKTFRYPKYQYIELIESTYGSNQPNTIWTYSLQVTSTSVSIVTVNVSATDMAGNDLVNQEHIRFVIDTNFLNHK